MAVKGARCLTNAQAFALNKHLEQRGKEYVLHTHDAKIAEDASVALGFAVNVSHVGSSRKTLGITKHVGAKKVRTVNFDALRASELERAVRMLTASLLALYDQLDETQQHGNNIKPLLMLGIVEKERT